MHVNAQRIYWPALIPIVIPITQFTDSDAYVSSSWCVYSTRLAVFRPFILDIRQPKGRHEQLIVATRATDVDFEARTFKQVANTRQEVDARAT